LSLFQMDEDLVACMIDDLKHVRLVLSASGDTEVESLHKAFPEYIKMSLYNELYWIGITFDRPQQYYKVLCEAKDGRKVQETVHSFEELEQFAIDFIKKGTRKPGE
jgi:hypothetical protein